MDAMGQAVEQRFLEDPFDRAAASRRRTPRPGPGCGSPASCPTTPAVHAAALTFVSDLTLLSAGFARLGGGWRRTSSARASTTRSGSTAPVRADEWFLYETDSPAASGGPGAVLRPDLGRRRHPRRHGGPGGPHPVAERLDRTRLPVLARSDGPPAADAVARPRSLRRPAASAAARCGLLALLGLGAARAPASAARAARAPARPRARRRPPRSRRPASRAPRAAAPTPARRGRGWWRARRRPRAAPPARATVVWVRNTSPPSLSRSSSVMVATSASTSSAQRGRRQTSESGCAVATSNRSSASAQPASSWASATCERMWARSPSAPYQRRTNHSFSARNRRPSGICQSRKSTTAPASVAALRRYSGRIDSAPVSAARSATQKSVASKPVSSHLCASVV